MMRVLIAEDEPAILFLLAEVVKRMGHTCLCARDGQEALQLARRTHPDLVVTDFRMPKLNGIDFIQELRDDPSLHRIPVLLMTAADPQAVDRGLASHCLQKPFNLAEFEDAIRVVLQGAHVL